MPAPVAGPSSSTIAATTTPAASPLASNPASTSSATPTTNSSATRSSKPPRKTTWQTFKDLLPSSGAVQILMGLLGLILAIVGIKWAVRSYNMARWTELKDFRDDCRSVQATGAALSKACVEALHKELEPPPYAPIHFKRLAKGVFNPMKAMERGYQVLIEVWRSFKVCLETLLFGAGSRMAFQNWRWITSATELVGRFSDITLGRVRLSITSASQWTRHQAAEVPQYGETLSTAFVSWIRNLPFVSQNINLQELSSFLLHPLSFDCALSLLSTAQYFRYSKFTGFQMAIFSYVLLVHHHVQWPIWCSDRHGGLLRVITRTFNPIYFAFILLQRTPTNQEEDLAKASHNFVVKYPHLRSITMALIGIELCYEITLPHDVLLRSHAILIILFTTVEFLTILLLGYCYKSRGRALPNGVFSLEVVFLTHASELCFVIYCRRILLSWEWLWFLLLYSIFVMKMYSNLR
ncbi:hypothetical protein V8E51_018512 [Hyaloscypha variabilis]